MFLAHSGLEITFYQSLLSVAIKLSQELGLDRLRADRASMTKAEYDRRSRIFWISYAIDKGCAFPTCNLVSMLTKINSSSFIHGLMGCENIDDVDIDLPEDDLVKNTGLLTLSDGRKASLFRLFCELAVLRHKIYKSLYSTNSIYIDDSQYEYISQVLGNQLDSWRKSLPSDSEIHNPKTSMYQRDEGLILPRILVSYHSSIISLYQWSLFYRDNSHRRGPNDRKQDLRENWTLLCLSSARQIAVILQADNCRNTFGIR